MNTLILAAAAVILCLLAAYLLLSFVAGVVTGVKKSAHNRLEAEIRARMARHLENAPVLRAGDRMLVTGEMLRNIHRIADRDRVPCVVVGVVNGENGTKELRLQNLEPYELKK